jgi:hypothetical protein
VRANRSVASAVSFTENAGLGSACGAGCGMTGAGATGSSMISVTSDSLLKAAAMDANAGSMTGETSTRVLMEV